MKHAADDSHKGGSLSPRAAVAKDSCRVRNGIVDQPVGNGRTSPPPILPLPPRGARRKSSFEATRKGVRAHASRSRIIRKNEGKGITLARRGGNGTNRDRNSRGVPAVEALSRISAFDTRIRNFADSYSRGMSLARATREGVDSRLTLSPPPHSRRGALL